MGNVENIGPVVISLREEKQLTRILIRLPQETKYACQLHEKSSSIPSLKFMLQKSGLPITRKMLRKVRSHKLEPDLIRFDDSHVGVCHCDHWDTWY